MTDWKFPQLDCPKARKTYTCDLCDFTIHPGETYVRIVDIDMGKFVTARYCKPCGNGLYYYDYKQDLREDDFCLTHQSFIHFSLICSSVETKNFRKAEKVYLNV